MQLVRAASSLNSNLLPTHLQRGRCPPPHAQPAGTSGQQRLPHRASGRNGRGPEGGQAPQQPDAPAAQAAELQAGLPSVPRPAPDPISAPLLRAAQCEEARQAARQQQAGDANGLAALAPRGGLHSQSGVGKLGSAATAQVPELRQAAIMLDRYQLQTVACQLSVRVAYEIALRERLRRSDVEEAHDLQETAASTGKAPLVCPICGCQPFLSYVRCRCRLVPAVCLAALEACVQAPVGSHPIRAAFSSPCSEAGPSCSFKACLHECLLWGTALGQCPHAGVSGCELPGLLLSTKCLEVWQLYIGLQHQHWLAVIAACIAANAWVHLTTADFALCFPFRALLPLSA